MQPLREQGEATQIKDDYFVEDIAAQECSNPGATNPLEAPSSSDPRTQESPDIHSTITEADTSSYLTTRTSSEDSNNPATMSRHMATGKISSPTLTQSRHYQLVSPGPAADTKVMNQNTKDQLVQALRSHRINTITELRRVEKIFVQNPLAELADPMTQAWRHYVSSNNLLNELRGLTKTYPFSSECLDEAKQLVVRDPNSARSWNVCRLVLIKIEKENLILKHARAVASKTSTWGGRRPTQADFDRLIAACVTEWTRALRQMLRHWD